MNINNKGTTKTAIENSVELTALPDKGQDVFTNTNPLWAFAPARPIYGGTCIAHCLVAAQHTVPSDFFIHNMQCCFIKAGYSEFSIEYFVERVRDGKWFATRVVNARQKGETIFTATASFVREDIDSTREERRLEHERKMPPDLILPDQTEMDGKAEDGPFETRRAEILNKRSGHFADTKIRYWFRTKETIPKESGNRAHLAALAYMSDAYLIAAAVEAHGHIPILTYPIRFSMIASLNHTIYFHNPKAVQVDQWMCSERESPWAGDNRGLVIQSIWSHEGVLIATCVQEGILRLNQDFKRTKL
ncbi:Thioesterase-like superfamily domain containing protein [Elaphomyces granulatus]|jgi:acyl-CoA thioesterase II